MMRTLFLVGPEAGQGAALRVWRRVERLALEQGLYDWVAPASDQEARRIAREAVAAGIHRVVVVGGDNTLEAVAAELAFTDSALGMIPAVSGSDFCPSAGIPRDTAVAFAIATGQHTSRVDLGVAAGGYRFLNVAGALFRAEAGTYSMQLPSRSQRLFPALAALAQYRPVSVEIRVDDQTHRGEVMLVAVANGPQCGGGMRIAPGARRDDGLLDVCIVGGMSRTELVRILPGLYRGEHVNHPKVRMMQGREVHLRPWAREGAEACSFGVEPGALAMALPRQA
ncbi:MAG TPA: diacylglycerol kinase family protein [Symbiobacteriaceae bacterium]|nr:diacylglycerol kinase family protein [Symbiobacteriaceae bacterium]